MANNKKQWKSMMATTSDIEAEKEGIDSLETGLEGLSWIENSKRIVSTIRNKTRETFGEEIGNSISAGVLAFYILFMIPYASIRSYTNAPEGMARMDFLSVSGFMITAFLANLTTTIFHVLKHDTIHKRVFRKLDHIMVYWAILGVLTPPLMSLVGGTAGIIIISLELAMAVSGTLFMVFGYPDIKGLTRVAKAIYGLMIIPPLFVLKTIITNGTPLCSYLLLGGTVIYIIGLFFYSGKKFKFSHMVWHILVVLATVCHVLALVYFLR